MTKKILFVCTENSCRSQMAEALTRIHGGSTVEVHSAGSAPSGQVNPKAIKCLADIGYDLSTHQSKSLTEIPDIDYDYAITMGCGDSCPQVRAQHKEDWQLPDPRDFPQERFYELREIIEGKVKRLLNL